MSNYITVSRQINLSSNSAIISNSPLNSVLTFSTNGILKKEKEILYNLISVVHAEIPVSYYIVNETNNYLSLSTGNYTFTNGNYNATTFKNYVIEFIKCKLDIKFKFIIWNLYFRIYNKFYNKFNIYLL